MPPPEETVWLGWNKGFTPLPVGAPPSQASCAKKRREREERALEDLTRLHPSLTRGARDLTMTPRDLADLITKLCRRGGLDMRQQITDWLARVIERGRRELGWTIPNPPNYSRLLRESPYITVGEFRHVVFARQMDTWFVESLAKTEQFTLQARLGQLVYSAVSRGLLFQTTWQERFFLSREADYRCLQDLVWIEMQESGDLAEMAGEPRARRWVLDPVTARLLLHWREAGKADQPLVGNKTQAWKSLRIYFQEAGVPREFQPKNIAEFTHWQRVAACADLSRLLTRYARGRVTCTGLSPEAWFRVLTGKAVHRARPCGIDGRKTPAQKTDLNVGTTALRPVSAQLALLNRATTLLGAIGKGASRAKTSEALQRILEESKEHVTFIERLILEWLILHARQGRRKGGNLQATSALRYLGSLKRVLVMAFSDVDAQTLDAAGWLERLQRAIDDASDRMTGRQLLRFCAFLQTQKAVPAFDYLDLDLIEDDLAGVRANVVTVDEFERSMKRFKGASRLDRIRRLVSVLSFYAGLRNEEGCLLRFCDVHGRSAAELRVRSTSLNRLKRPTSERIIRLKALLPSRWYDEFMRYVSLRADELGPTNLTAPLFAMPGELKVPVREVDIVRPVQEALREITGDETVVFYNLRHSFANWLLVRLLIPMQPELACSRVAALRHPFFDPAACSELRARLGLPPSATAAVLDYVAACMGHISSTTTLAHYLHLFDLIEGMIKTSSVARLDEAAIQALTHADRYWYPLRRKLGATKKAGTRWGVPRLLRYWLKPCQTRWPDPMLKKVTRRQAAPTKSLPASGLDSVPLALRLLFVRKLQPERVADITELPLATVERINANAEALHHRQAGAGQRASQILPPKPRQAPDVQDVEKILRHLRRHPLGRRQLALAYDLVADADIHHGREILLHRPQEARAFAALLRALGVAEERIVFVLKPPRAVSHEDIESKRQYWSQVTGIPLARSFVKPEKSRRARRADSARQDLIAISVSQRPLHARRDSPTVQNYGSYGVRFVLYLLAVFGGSAGPAPQAQVATESI